MNPIQPVAVLLCALALCIGGCARSLPPHEELNRAVGKSIGASGLNYSSRSRITNLTLPKKDTQTAQGDSKRTKYLDTGLGVIQGLSVNVDGAIDMKAKKSEVLYDLHYDKDNVEVSIKIPLLFDHDSQTIYVGTSLFNTILETVYPLAPAAKGRMIRIRIDELLQQGATKTPEFSTIIGEKRFSPANIELFNNAIKAGIVKALARLNDAAFSDQPLSGEDRKAGVERRIHLDLGHNDSVSVVLDLIEAVTLSLHQDGVISKSEYDTLHALSDRKTLDGVVDKFNLTMKVDFGIDQSGFVSRVESQLNVADREGLYQLGINNLSSFGNYNTPRFSMNPAAGDVVDFKDILEALAADKAKEMAGPKSNADTPGEPGRPEKEATP